MATGRGSAERDDSRGSANDSSRTRAKPESNLEKVPPFDESAERGVLGAMLIEAQAAYIAVEELKAEDFYLPRHRTLFKVLTELFQRTENLDELVVVSELNRQGLLESVGGRDEIGKLIIDTPSAAGVENYCRLVRERAIERELIIGAATILQKVQQPGAGRIQDLIEEAEQIIFKISDTRASNDAVPMIELMSDALDSAEKVQAAKREGREIESPALPTHFVDLDRLLSGGLWPGELIIIAGRPSMGKTTFAINIARQISVGHEKSVKPTAIFSLEMPREQVAKNILCAQAGLSAQRMRRYDFDEKEFEDLRFWGKVLQEAPIFIDDTSGISINALRARVRRLRQRQDVRLVVIDYLQLMQGPPGKRDNREQEVAEISRGLKAIAREMKIPVIVLSQLNRSAEKRDNDKRPQLSDLRESGSIEQDADVVIMLYREEYYNLEKNAEHLNVGDAMVMKNRNGPVGNVKLTFQKDILRFVSYTPDQQAAGE